MGAVLNASTNMDDYNADILNFLKKYIERCDDLFYEGAYENAIFSSMRKSAGIILSVQMTQKGASKAWPFLCLAAESAITVLNH